MAISIEMRLTESAADILVGYGAGAKLHLYRSATELGSATEVGSGTTVVTGTETYNVWDTSGTDTSWYKWQVTDASGASITSDYIYLGQPGGSGDYVTPDLLRTQLDIDDAVDDDTIWAICDQVNDEINDYVGVFLGPVNDTTRTYHGRMAVCYQKRLWIPGGIRTLTAVSMGYLDNNTSTSCTITDFVLGPLSYELPPGDPYYYVELITYPTGGYYYFPPYTANVLLTGSFGRAAVKDSTIGVAVGLATRKLQARNVGGAGFTAPTSFGNGQIYPFLTQPEKDILDTDRRRVFSGVR